MTTSLYIILLSDKHTPNNSKEIFSAQNIIDKTAPNIIDKTNKSTTKPKTSQFLEIKLNICYYSNTGLPNGLEFNKF